MNVTQERRTSVANRLGLNQGSTSSMLRPMKPVVSGDRRVAGTSGVRAPSAQAVLATALLGLLAANVNISVLALAVGELAAEFSTTTTTMAWVVTGPMLAFAVLGPTAGKLGDLHGRRKVYLAGMAGCGLFAAAAAAAPTASALIACRTLSSVFGAATMPAGMAIVSTAFPEDQRVKALGYWGLAMSGGPMVGMVAGGPLLDQASWRWLFILQVPLVAAALLVAWRVLPRTAKLANVRFDGVGSILLAVALGGVVFAFNRAPTWGWGHPVVIGLLIAAPVATWAFIRQEARCPYPLIPVRYFRTRNFSAPMLGQLLISIGYQGGFVVLPLMLREVLDYSNGRISIVALARPLFYGLAGPVAGYYAVRVGERRTATLGAAVVALSSGALALIGPGTRDAFIFASLALAGAGYGTLFPPLTTAITTAVDQRDLGIAGASSSVMMQVGMVVGIQLHQTIQESREPVSGLLSSYREAFLVGAAVAVAGTVAVAQMRSLVREPTTLPAKRAWTGWLGRTRPGIGAAGDAAQGDSGRPGDAPGAQPVRAPG